jgi:hypothetical protein
MVRLPGGSAPGSTANDGVAAVAAQGDGAEEAARPRASQQDGNLEHRGEGEHRRELEAGSHHYMSSTIAGKAMPKHTSGL